mmetsp:Transcript_44006/g.82238  ORF Transcript_44006/g.82238 Transcript_44006/m.82238 type:complete len:200 (-) Transcript_44006:902-1501(-)
MLPVPLRGRERPVHAGGCVRRLPCPILLEEQLELSVFVSVFVLFVGGPVLPEVCRRQHPSAASDARERPGPEWQNMAGGMFQWHRGPALLHHRGLGWHLEWYGASDLQEPADHRGPHRRACAELRGPEDGRCRQGQPAQVRGKCWRQLLSGWNQQPWNLQRRVPRNRRGREHCLQQHLPEGLQGTRPGWSGLVGRLGKP